MLRPQVQARRRRRSFVHSGRDSRPWDNAMPLITVRVIENVFSARQKQAIITDLTDALVAIEGEAMRGVTWCMIEEVKSGDWAIGGQALTTGAVQAMAGMSGADRVVEATLD